jgi:transglutaminase-like putative cysteine protease
MSERAEKTAEMHFSIRYLTKYRYDAEVVDNINTLRVKPAANGRQRVDEFTVRLTPEVRLHRHEDYFGTEVVEFEVTRPHREMTIDVRAKVSTQAQPQPRGTSWESLRDPVYQTAASEFLLATDDVAGHPKLVALHGAVSEAPTPLAAVMMVSDMIPDHFEYRPGATYVDSPLSVLLDGGAGVCQDFAHLGLTLLRHQGIAARYVSGYFYTTEGGFAAAAVPPTIITAEADRSAPGPRASAAEAERRAPQRGAAADPERSAAQPPTSTAIESVEVDTHAWIEALLPGDDGEPFWVSIDPTNRGLAGERHVKIGHGRHYADVPPIKGVYRGAANADLETRVTMTRVDSADPVAAARG